MHKKKQNEKHKSGHDPIEPYVEFELLSVLPNNHMVTTSFIVPKSRENTIKQFILHSKKTFFETSNKDDLKTNIEVMLDFSLVVSVKIAPLKGDDRGI